MEHFYKDIYGFSGVDLFALYKKMVDRFDSGSHFVEVGAFLGRSAIFMAVEIINSGKNIKFDCVDHWEGSEEHNDNDEVNLETLYEDFLENIKPVEGIINLIVLNLPSIVCQQFLTSHYQKTILQRLLHLHYLYRRLRLLHLP